MRAAQLLALVVITATASAAGADLKPIVEPYLRIQEALSADALEGVKENAARIADRAAALGVGSDRLQAAAGAFEAADDLAAARAAFHELGDALMVYAKENDGALGDGVKVAYCPMARKYWLQTGEKIRNPFYGAAMLECGRFNPTLPELKK